MREEFDFRRYPKDSFQVGPFKVTARRVNHPVPAYALRVEAGGKVLAYSGDTGICDALTETAIEADVFLCEASFVEGGDNPPDLHLTGAEAAAVAARADAKRLLLTHIPPWHDPKVVLAEAQGHFVGRLSLAEVGRTYQL